MTTFDDAPPNEVWLDLMQGYRDSIEAIADIQAFLPRPRFLEDPLPSLHAVLDTAEPAQRTIGSGKKVLDRVNVRILYYDADYRNIWKMYKTIKQIIVGNNQVKSTSQYADTGIEWSMLGTVDFDVLATDREVALNYMEIVVQSAYQDNY